MAYTYKRGLSGLGCMQVSDLVAACGGQGTGACSPLDPGCVATNQAIIDWAEGVQEQYLMNGGQCIPDGTPCGYTSPGSGAVTTAYMANQPIEGPGSPGCAPPACGGECGPCPSGSAAPANVSNPQPVQLCPSGWTGTYPACVAPASAVASSSSVPAATNPAGATVINSSGASQPAQTTTTSTSDNWFTDSMFDSIPNWMLLAGVAGIGAVILMGSHR
jgi:hypothetical protein